MDRLDIETWEGIFKNAEEVGVEVEIAYVIETKTDNGSWGICVCDEAIEYGFDTVEQARERLEYIVSKVNM